MKKLYIYLITAIMISVSCQDDPMDTIEDFKYREKNIVTIEFDIDGIRSPKITREGDDARIDILYYQPVQFDLSSVPVKSISTSYRSTASAQAGTILNFDNAEKTAIITVTAESGETLDWKVVMAGI